MQNTYDPTTRQSRSLFTGALRRLAHAYTAKTERVLCIGMGAGVVPMQFAADELKRMWWRSTVPRFYGGGVFDFDASKVNLTVGDGRQFLNQTDRTYDAILPDAFLGIPTEPPYDS